VDLTSNTREMSRPPACCGRAAQLSGRNQVGRSRRRRDRLHWAVRAALWRERFNGSSRGCWCREAARTITA